MIRSFGNRESEDIWWGQRSRKLPPDIQLNALRKMRILNRITQPADLRIPRGNRFEELKGDRKGAYSIRINDQWRITFGGADDVRIEDYHR